MINQRYANDGRASINLNETQINAKNALLRKLEKNEYKYENIECECGSKSFEILTEKDRYGINVNTVICKDCGLIMTNPRMTQESYNLFYDNEYRRLYNGDDTPKDSFFMEQYERGILINNYIKDSIDNYSKIKNVLEIGCGAGGILQSFYNEGCEVTGIDLGCEYIEFGIEKGLNLLCCSSKELVKAQKKKYDLVILCHVFEHFLDLKNELEVIKQLMSPNGVIYIEVPGIKNLHNSYECDLLKYLQNAHTYNFSLNTLKQVMEWNSFEFINGDEVVRSLFRIKNCEDQRNIINYYEDNINYILDLERKREYYLKNYNVKKNNYENFKNKEAFAKVKKKICGYEEQSVLIYGTGTHTKSLCKYLGKCSQIKGLVDNDAGKIGQSMYGYEVLNLENEKNNIKLIIISSLDYQEEIYKRIIYLEDYGIEVFKIYE